MQVCSFVKTEILSHFLSVPVVTSKCFFITLWIFVMLVRRNWKILDCSEVRQLQL